LIENSCRISQKGPAAQIFPVFGKIISIRLTSKHGQEIASSFGIAGGQDGDAGEDCVLACGAL
jgi:hypothetical protein